jgi:hypothetical protein
MNIHNAAHAVRDWGVRFARASKPYIKEAAKFAVENREVLIGGAVGYMAGKIIEQIPIVGRLLKPLPSLLFGAGGAYVGHTQDLQRRKIEALRNRPTN